MAASRKKRKEFGEWLDITLSNRRIMSRALAGDLGVHDSAVSRWRAGAGVPAMDTTFRLAEILDVDPMRLAVTAGHVPEEVAGVEPLPMPEPTERHESVRRQIGRIRGVTDQTRRKILAAYEEDIHTEARQ